MRDRRTSAIPWLDLAITALLVAVPTLLHYVTSHELHYLHGIFRRLYYLPILYAALRTGLVGSLVTAGVVTAVYVPHAFIARFHDPGTTTEKILEIVLYFVVAAVAGLLVNRLQREVRTHKRIAEELRTSIERREQAEAQLRLADRLAALGQLTAGLAHEIRNPLGTIKGAAQIMEDYHGEDDPRRKVVELLVRETDHLDAVLGRFLDFARPASPGTSEVDLGRLARETAEMLEAQRKEGGHTIEVEPSATGFSVRGDATLLKQVFVNLGLNALQAMPAGGALRIGLERRGGSCAVLFEDEGPGIPEQDLPSIFNPFFTTKHRGEGLGLAVSYRIVRDHGGEIHVENRTGGGCRFTVILPRGGGG